MKILTHTIHPEIELFQKLRQVSMRTDPERRIYASSGMETREVTPDLIAVAQRYLLREQLEKIEELYRAFREQFGIDLFALTGYVTFTTDEDPELVIDFLPVVVEEDRNDGNAMLICDGAHRMWVAKKLHKRPTVVFIRDVPADLPYYAHANDHGWNDVTVVDEPPEAGSDDRRNYRQKDYKPLFRNFNSAFNNVTSKRKTK